MEAKELGTYHEPSVLDDNAPAPALPKGTIDQVYENKANALNAAIQKIGMGSYQW